MIRLPFDLTDLDNFAHGFPHDMFVAHRRDAPVYWHEPTKHTPDNEGFWSVATYAETLQVQKDPEAYSSERGGERACGGTLLQDLPIAGMILNMMDGTRHARIRRLVSTGLTPRTIGRLEAELRRRTRVLLDTIEDGVTFDFLPRVAGELPMQAICILLGVPEEDRHWLFECIEHAFDFRGDREAFETTDEAAAAHGRMFEYGHALIAAKRAHPTDDMLSVVVHATLADVDPPTLSDAELYTFFNLLFAAGADTTRNAIAGGMLALIERPEQLARLQAEPRYLGTAVEEMLRWTSPSPSKRRTATRTTALGGHTIRPGDKVLYWEGSANRDERVFADAMAFDVTRDPNPHLALGHGVHFCLGGNLARLEMRVVFEDLLSRFTDFERAGAVEWTRSNRHTGIRHLPVQMRRRQDTRNREQGTGNR
jgi:cytochrome P450